MQQHLQMCDKKSLLFCLCLISIHVSEAYSFDKCFAQIESIRNGTASVNGVTNDTLPHYIYTGDIRGFDNSIPREKILTTTFEGCNKICGASNIAWNDIQPGFNFAATWLFPLMIFLGLPFESYHKRKIRRTLADVSIWLGSPATAIAACVWNFRQTREAHQKVMELTGPNRLWLDSFYVLSCFNQFDLDSDHSKAAVARADPENSHGSSQNLEHDGVNLILHALVYGLFRPLSQVPQASTELIELGRRPNDPLHDSRIVINNREINNREIQLTRELLSELAHQLRMHRRRGVVPTLASLGTFLLAFIFSVVLAFGDIKDDTILFFLDIGLFFSWLPILIIFAIVDRNPISSERQAILMSRWLYNADAIYKWAEEEKDRITDMGHANLDVEHSDQRQGHVTGEQSIPDTHRIRWWKPAVRDLSPYRVGDFVGQGRGLKYCGLTSAVLHCFPKDSFQAWTQRTAAGLTQSIDSSLSGHRPLSWRVVSSLSLMIVWLHVLLAFLVDFIIPTVGVGCYALMFLLFGGSNTVTWALEMCSPSRRYTPAWRMVAYTFNTLSVLWILFIIVAVASGLLNNCYCNSALPGYPLYGGYMSFEKFGFYLQHFNLRTPWIIAAVVGALAPSIALVTALAWWWKCKHLWTGVEQGSQDRGGRTMIANMDWLRE